MNTTQVNLGVEGTITVSLPPTLPQPSPGFNLPLRPTLAPWHADGAE